MMPKWWVISQGTSRTAMVAAALLRMGVWSILFVVHLVDVVAGKDQHVVRIILLDEADI
jgi:hypothetical protein